MSSLPADPGEFLTTLGQSAILNISVLLSWTQVLAKTIL